MLHGCPTPPTSLLQFVSIAILQLLNLCHLMETRFEQCASHIIDIGNYNIPLRATVAHPLFLEEKTFQINV